MKEWVLLKLEGLHARSQLKNVSGKAYLILKHDFDNGLAIDYNGSNFIDERMSHKT